MILPERTGQSFQEHHENAQGEEHEMASNKVKAGKHRVWRPLMGESSSRYFAAPSEEHGGSGAGRCCFANHAPHEVWGTANVAATQRMKRATAEKEGGGESREEDLFYGGKRGFVKQCVIPATSLVCQGGDSPVWAVLLPVLTPPSFWLKTAALCLKNANSSARMVSVP